MDVGRQSVGIVQGSDANETDPFLQAAHEIMAPNRDLAGWAANDGLAPPAGGGCVDALEFAAQLGDPRGLDQGIQRKGGAGLALAPTTMASMHDQGFRFDAVADRTAATTAVTGFRGDVIWGLELC